MNWARGLFRLWIVTSFAWAALIVFLGPTGVVQIWAKPIFVVPPPETVPPDCFPDNANSIGKTGATTDTALTLAERDALDALNNPKPSCNKGRFETNELTSPPLVRAWYDRWVKYFAALALAPLLLLLAGGGLLWASRGFARPN